MQLEGVSPDVIRRVREHLTRVVPVEPGREVHRDLDQRLPKPKPAKKEGSMRKPQRSVAFSHIQNTGELDRMLENPDVMIVLTWQEADALISGLARYGVKIDSLPREKYRVLPRQDSTGHVDSLA
jgi:hypothetical protein